MPSTGQLIRDQRLARNWTLRRLATELGVTPAYVSDLEADRRLPSKDLKIRLSEVLGIGPEELAAADSRMPPELREWIEERPGLMSLLRSLRNSPESEHLIHRLTRLMTRRSRPQTPRGLLVTWESELRAIAAEAAAWSVETGGDIFGRWHDVPTMLLATKAGPSAQRDQAHFRLDVDYLRTLSEVLATDWDLRYFGDWHSHHRLGLVSPSGGDQRRIRGIGNRNQFPAMAELIVTLEEAAGEPLVRIHPWVYDLLLHDPGPSPLNLRVLPGISPVREALLARRALPEQELFAWEKVPLTRIRIGTETAPPAVEPSRDVDTVTRERALAHLAEALGEASGHPVEQHATGFGCVLVARLDEPYYLAFALNTPWPMTVLEVHRLNRDTGTSDVVATPSRLPGLDLVGILDLYRAARSPERHARVDS
jgi:transcriptional regulator with XRE-family HTH domain